jgi:hypothetical protein
VIFPALARLNPAGARRFGSRPAAFRVAHAIQTTLCCFCQEGRMRNQIQSACGRTPIRRNRGHFIRPDLESARHETPLSNSNTSGFVQCELPLNLTWMDREKFVNRRHCQVATAFRKPDSNSLGDSHLPPGAARIRIRRAQMTRHPAVSFPLILHEH